MKFIIILLGLCLPVSSYAADILAIEQGLTLAQVNHQGVLNTLAVLEDKGGYVTTINLSELSNTQGDIIFTYQHLGYKKMTAMIRNAHQGHYQRVKLSQLQSPAGQQAKHIALGFNYTEHADEINEARRPFLFLKTVIPGRETAIATDNQTLLDYEVEICARPLTTIQSAQQSLDQHIGFFVCGDFTDRAALMRNIDLDNMHSGKGFNEAKSRPNYFPTGPYMVIPKQVSTFLSSVSFSLQRNGQTMQQASAGQMIWTLDTMIEQIFQAHNTQQLTQAVGHSDWLINQQMTPDMNILTGTPSGVILRPPSIGFKVWHGLLYILTGHFIDMAPRAYVIERYIESQLSDGLFLQPGEKVTLSARFMGELNIQITQAAGIQSSNLGHP